jgi:hypothetical protein
MRIRLALVLSIVAAFPATAQSLNQARVGLSNPVRTSGLAIPVRMAVRSGTDRSYWLEGTIVGAVIGLAGGFAIRNAGCGEIAGGCSSSSTVLAFAPAVALAVLGGLLGSTIHKD